MAQTVQQNFQPNAFDVRVETITPPAKKKMSPILFGIGGVVAFVVIVVLGVGTMYMLGVFRTKGPVVNSNTASPTPSPAASPVIAATNELIAIPGGTFKMGRNDGRENERPENPVTVASFRMDRTEVTNAEYYAFVSESGYRPMPAHWPNDKPTPGEEKMPVRFVDIEDVNAFARWRSKRDGITYRLPTEAEWEYAARNGAKGNLYPWGDTFQPKCAVTDKENTEPDAVGTASCPNDWGIVDLIGNVYEWTGSKANLYPGSKGKIREAAEPRYMIRGGGAFNKSTGEFAITSTFRADVSMRSRDKELGFRLVAEK